jgi:ubiquinol-cytochrome c reductase cytochrome c1 subunit
MRISALVLGAALSLGLASSHGPAQAAEGTDAPPEQHWSFNGIFGTYDRAALQRGFQVYEGVCHACHGAQYLAFRNLGDIGLSEDAVKAIAANYQVTDGPNDSGDMFERPGRPSDRIPSPFPNEQAARASNGGAYPPDLSLLAKAREHGPDYIYAVLTGYEEPPADITVPDGMNYNRYFPGHMIAMPPPLSEGAVTYEDGTEATVPQMSADVTQFLMWLAEPKMEERKQTGVKVALFLIVLTGLLYAYKRKVWADVH